MDLFASLTVILSGLVGQLPVILVSLLGVVVSLVRRRDAPTAAGWTLAASLASLFIALAVPVTRQLALEYGQRSALPAASIGVIFGALGFFWACLHAATVGLFLVGAFAGRGAAVPSPAAGPASDNPPPSPPLPTPR